MPAIRNSGILALALLATAVTLVCSCSTTSTLAPFQPEIVSNQDNFQFQATKVERVTATLNYSWSNTGTRATINHSSAVTSGSARIQIADANGTEVYSSPLLASGTPASAAGVAGTWTITVTLSSCYGTLNFRVQKL